MQNDNEELTQLKEVYDLLWSDAKALAKEIRKNISVYWYATWLTIMVSVVIASSLISNLVPILYGNANWLNWFNFVIGTIGVVATIAYGAKLLQWYRELRRKYSKLIEMEKSLGDK